MRRLTGVLLILFARTASADPLEVDLRSQVPAGKKPALLVKALDNVRGVRVELTRDEDGKTFVVQHGPMRLGTRAELPFGDGRGGRSHWHAQLIVALTDGNQDSRELTLETVTIGELNIGYRKDKLDLDAHVLEFTLSRAAGSAELHVFAEDGSEIGATQATYHGEPPGTWLRIAWTPTAAKNVMRLELRAVAADGPVGTVKLVPWSVPIPHDEVVFETGKWIIRPTEEAKLEASLPKIKQTVEAAHRGDPTLEVRLFIAGHTDTVGNSADNRKLSLERARAIAGWFKAKGIALPIAYTGFGEDVPKIRTPDNTDEERNRRADYILGVEEPPLGPGRAEWHVLK